MRCYICDELVNEDGDSVVCINCGNEFHVNCVSTDDKCPVCGSIGTLGIISDCVEE